MSNNHLSPLLYPRGTNERNLLQFAPNIMKKMFVQKLKYILGAVSKVLTPHGNCIIQYFHKKN